MSYAAPLLALVAGLLLAACGGNGDAVDEPQPDGPHRDLEACKDPSRPPADCPWFVGP